MSVERLARYTCDEKYCQSKATVKASGRMEHEYRDEFPILESRGWSTSGVKTFCPKHKEKKNP